MFLFLMAPAKRKRIFGCITKMGQTQVLHLPFMGGLDEKTSLFYLDPSSKLATITNGNFTKVGSIQKRLGLEFLTAGVVGKVNSWSKSSIVSLSTSGVSDINDSQTQFPSLGNLSPIKSVRRPITTTPPEFSATFGDSNNISPNICDFPVGDDLYRLIAFPSTNSPSGMATFDVTVISANSGDIIYPALFNGSPFFTGTGTPGFPNGILINQIFYLPNAAPGTQVVIIWTDMTADVVYGSTYSPITNTFTSPTTIIPNGILGVFALDAVPFNGDPAGGWILFYPNIHSGTATQVSYQYLTSTFSVISSGIVDTSGFPNQIKADMYCAANYGETVVFVYAFENPATGDYTGKWVNYSADANFTVTNGPNVAVTVNPTPLQIIPPIITKNFSVLTGFLESVTLNAPNPSGVGTLPVQTFGGQSQLLSHTSSGILAGVWPLGCYPVARGFRNPGNNPTEIPYQPVELALSTPTEPGLVDPSTGNLVPFSQQGTLFLLQWVGEYQVVSTVAPRQKVISAQPIISNVLAQNSIPLCSGQYNGTRQALGLKIQGVDSSASSGSIPSSWTADFYFDTESQSDLYQSQELGQELHIAGSYPSILDGSNVVEDSFFFYPEFSHVTQSGSGSPLFGNYTYAIVYSYVDGSGLLQRSVPVFTNPIALSGGQNPLVKILPMGLTYKSQVYAEIYRTTSSPATPVFYLIDRILVSGPGSSSIPIGTVYVEYIDTIQDFSITTASTLYTTGGILDNPCPPCLNFQTVHKGRLWGVDETLRVIWFTQAYSPGLVPSWNELMTIQVPDGGDIIAISELDDKLIVWKASSIWVIYGGDGLSITGSGSDITNPQRIASDVGAISWQSIVLTPVGLMFQAGSGSGSGSGGIYLLDRSLSVTFIGKNVSDTLSSFPTVTASVLVPGAQQVRFFCSNGTSNTTICYDYLLQQWTTHVYAQILGYVVSACLGNAGQLVLMDSGGNIWQEHLPSDTNAYLDEDISSTDHFVTTTIMTAPIKIQGVQGYMRARRAMLLANRLDDCGFTMGLSVNYQPAIVQTRTWESTQIDELPYDQVSMHMAGAYNKVMSIQLTVNDTEGTNSTNGQGAQFESLAVELDQIGNRFRRIPRQGKA
jgi:hypothetical protein